MVAQTPGDRNDVPIALENKTGVGGNLEDEFVEKSAPDGYTQIFSWTGPLAVTAFLFNKLPHDPIKNFALAGLAGYFSLVLTYVTTHIKGQPQFTPISSTELSTWVSKVRAHPFRTPTEFFEKIIAETSKRHNIVKHSKTESL